MVQEKTLILLFIIFFIMLFAFWDMIKDILSIDCWFRKYKPLNIFFTSLFIFMMIYLISIIILTFLWMLTI